MILSLQAERRLSVTELASPGVERAALARQRAETDGAAARIREFGAGGDRWLSGAGRVRDRADELVGRLSTLDQLRGAVDEGTLDRAEAATAYTELIDAGFAVYGAKWTSRESDLIEQTRAFVALARAREVLAREDTLVTGALVARELTGTDRSRLAELVAAQRFVRAEAAVALPAVEREEYELLSGGAGLSALRALEDQLVGPGSDERLAPIAPQTWRATVEPVLSELRDLVAAGVRDSTARAAPSVAGTVIRTGLVCGLGFVVVVAALVGAVGASRQLDVGRRDATGPPDPPGTNGPADPTGRPGTNGPADPTGPAGRGAIADDPTAAGGKGRTMLARAEQQQEHELFLHLTRRNQVLLRRQLKLLNAMERRETGAEELADLFRVDHLATRIRRNVEKLISAAGAEPGRRWRRPVPLIDVVRGAVAEVEHYPRVLVSSAWVGALRGPAVTDLIHLLAELIENALTFSPPTSTVRVGPENHAAGLVIVVVDDGPGLGVDALDEMNVVLADPPPVRPSSVGLGLYGVARTARRWGLTVTLGTSPRGGTTARVLVPATLTVKTANPAAGGPAGATGAAGGRGRSAESRPGSGPADPGDKAGAPTAELPRLAQPATAGQPSLPDRRRRA